MQTELDRTGRAVMTIALILNAQRLLSLEDGLLDDSPYWAADSRHYVRWAYGVKDSIFDYVNLYRARTEIVELVGEIFSALDVFIAGARKHSAGAAVPRSDYFRDQTALQEMVAELKGRIEEIMHSPLAAVPEPERREILEQLKHA